MSQLTMRVIQCVHSLARTYGLGIYTITLPSSGFSVAHCDKSDETYFQYIFECENYTVIRDAFLQKTSYIYHLNVHTILNGSKGIMLGLHIATMHYKCQESPFVTEDHKFDLNLMVWTRGFTHCHELLRCVTANDTNGWRIVTNHYTQSRILYRAVAIY